MSGILLSIEFVNTCRMGLALGSRGQTSIVANCFQGYARALTATEVAQMYSSCTQTAVWFVPIETLSYVASGGVMQYTYNSSYPFGEYYNSSYPAGSYPSSNASMPMPPGGSGGTGTG